MGVWTLLAQTRLTGQGDRWLLGRLLGRLANGKPLGADELAALKLVYERSEPRRRYAALVDAVTPRAMAHWQALEADQDSALGEDALLALGDVVVGGAPELRQAAAPHLGANARAGDAPRLRQASFELLLAIDPRAAAATALDELRAGRQDLLGACLAISAPREYATIVAQLAVAAFADPTARPLLGAYLRAQLPRRHPTFAASALYALDTLDPGALPELLRDAGPGAPEPLAILAEALRADTTLHRAPARRLLQRAVGHADPRVWQPCLLELARLDPPGALAACRAMLRRGDGERCDYLLAQRRNNGALPILLALAADGPSERRRVLGLLQPALGLAPEVVARLVVAPEPLADLLFPRAMRPATPAKAMLKIDEALREPDSSITGIRITAWVYQWDGRPTDIVVTGHATPEVCTAVTSRLIDAMLNAGRAMDEGALLVAGAFLLRLPPDGPAPTPLERLMPALRSLADQTGLVKIHTARQASYDDAVATLRGRIEAGLRAGAPVILQQPRTGDPPRAMLLPFFAFHDPRPLRFTLPAALFGPHLGRLLQIHKLSVEGEMQPQAGRRQETYQAWLAEDRVRLEACAVELLERLLPGESVAPRREGLARELYAELSQGEGFRRRARRRYEQARQLLPEKLRPAEASSDEQVVAQGAALRRHLTPANLRELDLAGAAELLDWLRTKEPGANPALDGQGLAALAPTRGQLELRRDYPEARVEVRVAIDEPITSLVELAEVGLPGLIALDEQWLASAQSLPDDGAGSAQRAENFRAINLSTLIDPFLRGWPPVFLAKDEHKADYLAWCSARRAAVWQAIHAELLARGVRCDPLCADNVVFAARAELGFIEITPYAVTTDQECLVLLDRQVGMTWYLYPWQYREVTSFRLPAARRPAASAAVAQAEAALAAGMEREATEHYMRAMRIHPVRALKEILALAGAELLPDTSAEVEARLPLARAVEAFSAERIPPPRAVLEAAVERYPELVAEPYLFHGMAADAATPALARSAAALSEDRQRLRQLVPELERAMMVVRNAQAKETSEYMVGHYLALYAPTINKTIAEFRALRERVSELSESCELDARALLARVAERDEPFWRKAIELEPGLGELLASGAYQPSAGYQRHFEPVLKHRLAMDYAALVNRLKAHYDAIDKLLPLIEQRQEPEERGEFEDDLNQLMNDVFSARRLAKEYQWPDDNVASPRRVLLGKRDDDALGVLERDIAAVLDRSAGHPQVVAALERLLEALRSPAEAGSWFDPSASRDRLRAQVRAALGDATYRLAEQAFELLSQAARAAPELTSIRQHRVNLAYSFHYYKTGLLNLNHRQDMPLLASLRFERYAVLDARPAGLTRVEFDSEAQTISILVPGEGLRPLLRFWGLREEDVQYLATEMREELTSTKLRAARDLAPAYALLLKPMRAPARTRCRGKALADEQLQASLIIALAYLGPPELDPAAQEQAEADYDGEEPVIDGVAFSPRLARDAVGGLLPGPTPPLVTAGG